MIIVKYEIQKNACVHVVNTTDNIPFTVLPLLQLTNNANFVKQYSKHEGCR